MINEKIQLLRDPKISPTSEVIANVLKDSNDAYLNFLNRLLDYNINLEWRYYTDGKSWLGKGIYTSYGKRGGKKDITIFWLSMWDGFFKLTIYLSEKYRTDILDNIVSDEVKLKIKNSKQLGKTLKFFPIHFDVDKDTSLDNIFNVLDLKKKFIN